MTTNQPVHTIRLGALRAAIWRNESNDRVRYTVTFERTYRDKDGNPQSTTSFSHGDLPVLQALARYAEKRVFAHIEVDEMRNYSPDTEEASS